MTAKSRRRKFDKRRKSDEHPQPRRTEAEARREACKRDHPAGKGLVNLQAADIDWSQYNNFQEVFGEAASGKGIRIHSRVGRKGPYWEVEELDRGLGEFGPFTPEYQADEDALRRAIEHREEDYREEALREAGTSDTEASSRQRGFGSAEEVIGAILDAKERWKQPGSAQGSPTGCLDWPNA